MTRRLLFIFLFLPIAALGQYHITGKVVNLADKKPVANASVFLNNASAGTTTGEDGAFDIANVRGGYYDLVVSIVGYTAHHQDVAVTENISLPDIGIEAKTIVLKEVTIGPNRDWDANYARFKYDFLGSSKNAQQCKILNPEVLDLNYDAQKKELTASSGDFIIIENRALGYRVKYLLTSFTKSYIHDAGEPLYYEGSIHFEDLKGSKSEIKEWLQNRLDAYLGSDMHFLRSVVAATVEKEGFVVRQLIRQQDARAKKAGIVKYNETLVQNPLRLNEYIKLTDQKNQYAIAFKDCLHVTYHKMPENKNIPSVMSFTQPYTYFDDNGVIINPKSAVLEQGWSLSRLAEMLPVDYEPIK